jgi:hypothetical protein
MTTVPRRLQSVRGADLQARRPVGTGERLVFVWDARHRAVGPGGVQKGTGLLPAPAMGGLAGCGQGFSFPAVLAAARKGRIT